jgi:hypothetical protein
MTIYSCDTCNAACQADELDEAGDCSTCIDARIAKAYAYYRPLYDGEKHAGLLKTDGEYRADIIDAGRGHLLK